MSDSAEQTILSRVQACGVEWTPAQQQCHLFAVCLRVTAAGIQQYGLQRYQPSAFWMVPAYAVDLADAVIQEHVCRTS